MKPLRVLHINTEPTWRGGEVQTLMLARGLAAFGHASIVAARKASPLDDEARKAGLTVVPLPMNGEFDPVSILGLASAVREEKIDLLHYHTSHAVTLGTSATVIAGRRAAVLTRRVSFSLRRNPLARFKYAYRVDHLIAVSDSVRWVMIAEGVAPERVSVVHSGIDLTRYPAARDRQRLARELAIPEDAFVVGCVGHLAAHKGHAVLLDAVARIASQVPQLRVLIVGDGELRGQLEAQAAREPLAGRVTFAGFRADVPELMACCDLYVLASVSGEGSPGVIKEAMASRVPVIATGLDGVREIVTEGREALIVPAGDPVRLGDAILRVAGDPGLRASLAESGMARVKDFSAETMVARTQEVYQQVLARGGGRRA